MSAYYAIAYDDRVEILTDGVVYKPDGTVVAIREKVWRSPHVPMAITGRGDIGAIEAFASACRLLSTCGSFDKAIEAIAEFIAAKSDCVSHQCEMLITGFSESAGPVVYFVTTHEAYEGVTPWVLHNVDREIVGGPALEPDEIEGLDASGGLAGCAVAIFDAMRAKKAPNPVSPDLPPVYGIGGHIDLTIIDASGTRTERIHTWAEDVVGEKIAPGKYAKTPISINHLGVFRR